MWRDFQSIIIFILITFFSVLFCLQQRDYSEVTNVEGVGEGGRIGGW